MGQGADMTDAQNEALLVLLATIANQTRSLVDIERSLRIIAEAVEADQNPEAPSKSGRSL